MKSCLAWTVILASSLVSASPVLQERQSDDPPGSVLPQPSGDLPEPTANPTLGTDGNGKFQWQIWAKCDDASKTAVTKAWEDSKQFSDALNSWVPGGAFQAAMDMYMGNRSTYNPPFGDFNFPQQIQDTAKRHRGLFDGKSSYGNANLWVYCNEDSFWFGHCRNSGAGVTIAYETEDYYFNNWYITFCPPFFDRRYELGFEDKVRYIDAHPDKNMDVIRGVPAFQAGVFFHETMHMSQIVTSPMAVDYAYNAAPVYELARDRNTDAAVYNADSWLVVAEAIWAQQHYNLNDPPKPAKYTDGADTSDVGQDLPDVIYVDAAGVTPQGASDASDGNYFVDPSLWQVYIPGQGLAPLSSSTTTDTSTPTDTSTSTGTSTPTVTCQIGSTRDVGPYCDCSSGDDHVTAKPLATPPPGADECAYSTLPSGDEILSAIWTSTSSLQPSPTDAPAPTTDPAPASTLAPYATTGDIGVQGGQDKCHVHVWEMQDCSDDSTNLSAQIEIYDAAGNGILAKGDPISINNDNPGSWGSVLENELKLTGEHQGNYIQFNYGDLSWQSGTSDQPDTSQPQWCSVGGWDPKEGPECDSYGTDTLSPTTRQMDCYFPCPWNGGPSSSP